MAIAAVAAISNKKFDPSFRNTERRIVQINAPWWGNLENEFEQALKKTAKNCDNERKWALKTAVQQLQLG